MKATVNGAAVEMDVDPDGTAVELLRERLDHTGAKEVCGTGVCGACTVLLDGTPVVGCLTPCAALDGRSVTTVEGLGGDHPVQRAFATHDGLQCGYCTPGFVVEAVAFVDRWRAAHGDTAPPRTAIAEAMAGHLCRCGAYPGIYAAIAAACAGEHDAPADDRQAARVEAMDKVSGRARYPSDVRLAGQLEGVIVRSTRAHARVRAVDAGGAPIVDLLPSDRVVRYVGQPIAAVAAPSRRTARAIAAEAGVDYEPLPAVLDAATAGRPDAPVVYGDRPDRRHAPSSGEGPSTPARWRGNVRGPAGLSWRGRTAGRRIDAARNDQRLVAGIFTTPVQVHTPMEPHCGVAFWDEHGELHLYVSTQAVSLVAAEAASRWGLSPEKVHIVADHVGGGFGSKGALTVETVAAVELARTHQAPVRVALSRAEELTDAGNRPGTRTDLSMLADHRGRLAALTIDAYGDGGVSIGSSVATLALFMYGRTPRRLRDFDVVTNLPPGMPFRGPGGPPALWALEQSVDEMAHRLGDDPIALRRRWDGNPKRQVLYEWAQALPMWRERPPTGSPNGRFRRGVGIAAANWLYLLDPGVEVELAVDDGVVVARAAVQDMGTGSRTVLSEVVRAELGVPAERVRVEIGRSAAMHGPGSFGSSTTASIGPAARDACVRLRHALGAGPATDGATIANLLDAASRMRVVGRRRRDRRGYLTPFPIARALRPGRGFSGAVHVSEVEVDTLLGQVRVIRVWAGIAAGRRYAERLARSQCEGGVVQGIGFALHEERHVDPATGTVLTDNLEDYRIPGIADTPEIEVRFHASGWEHVDGQGVGLGEVSTIGVGASIGNAVYNATGWRPRDLPIRPDRLLQGVGR